MGVLGYICSFDSHTCHARLLSQFDVEGHIDQLMSVVDIGVRLNSRLKVSVVLQEFLQRLLSESNARLVIGIFVGQIDDLQKSNVGENLSGSWKVNHAEVVCGFQNEIQTQA